MATNLRKLGQSDVLFLLLIFMKFDGGLFNANVKIKVVGIEDKLAF